MSDQPTPKSKAPGNVISDDYKKAFNYVIEIQLMTPDEFVKLPKSEKEKFYKARKTLSKKDWRLITHTLGEAKNAIRRKNRSSSETKKHIDKYKGRKVHSSDEFDEPKVDKYKGRKVHSSDEFDETETIHDPNISENIKKWKKWLNEEMKGK